MKKGYKGTIIVSILMSLILIVVAFLVWPNKELKNNTSKKSLQSNEKDDSKTQIEILVKRINIRENKTIESKDLGDVYLGEIYTVLEDYESEDYYWYKITTNTNITGYIASLKDDEYVKIISGYIDRTPPVINYENDYYIMKKDDDYSSITCTDEHSDCHISITNDDLYLYVTATDLKGNETKKSIRYYEVYDVGSYFTEWNDNLTINYTKTLNQDNSMYLSATYILKKTIKSDNKSSLYSVSVNMYDENFNIIEDYYSKYNSNELDSSCKNNKEMALKEEYKNDDLSVGYNIRAVSTYRSYYYQKDLYNNYVAQDGKANADTYSARPGHSEHQTGYAVDIDNKNVNYTDFGNTKEFSWMKENAYKYGFILRYTKENEWITGYKDEPWHYRYVGEEIASYIQNNPMTFEEYYVRFLDN